MDDDRRKRTTMDHDGRGTATMMNEPKRPMRTTRAMTMTITIMNIINTGVIGITVVTRFCSSLLMGPPSAPISITKLLAPMSMLAFDLETLKLLRCLCLQHCNSFNRTQHVQGLQISKPHDHHWRLHRNAGHERMGYWYGWLCTTRKACILLRLRAVGF